MDNHSYRDTALYYCVDDLPGAQILAARLQKIIGDLRIGKPLTELSLYFLQQRGLETLHGLATGTLTYDSFRELGLAEQTIRIEAASAAKLASEAEKRTRRAEMQAKSTLFFEARESDPKHLAKIRNQELRARYGINTFVEDHCFGRLMKILKGVDGGQRLSEEDFVWLSSVGEDYFSVQLRTAYHRMEAAFFAREFEKTGDPWKAVSASKHHRKCDQADVADSLISSINIEQQKSPKLKSALYTTWGGAQRDLGQSDEALRLGEKAHAFKPDDYRPCTLLGAVHMETGNYSLGQEWYFKAVERGATLDAVDQDLRNIFFRADPAKKAEMSKFLLREDPARYAWAKNC